MSALIEYRLKPKPLTAKGFAAYGDIIDANAAAKHYSINYGHTERYHDLAKVDVNAAKGRASVNIFRSTPLPNPIHIRLMEQHPLSSQLFMPLGQQPYLIVVAPAGEFDINTLEAFIGQSHQGINYARGTWHHYCLALHKTSDFLVIDREGPGDNCVEVRTDKTHSIVIEFDQQTVN